MQRLLTYRFIRYSGVGIIGTATHFLCMIVLVEWGHTSPVLATSVGATVGAIVNYVLNHQFTFSSSRSHQVAFPRFAAIAILGIILAALIVKLGVLIGLHYVLSQIVASICILLLGFLLNKYWTF